jgi:sarcosine oxidase subunit beta
VQSYDVIVVGAGIFGASTAYHLKKGGVPKVLLIDKGSAPAQGTTGASAAIIRQHYSNRVLAAATGRSIEILRGLESVEAQGALFNPVGWYFLVPEEALVGARENLKMQQSAGIRAELALSDVAASANPWLNMDDGVAAVIFEPTSGYADPVRCTETFVNEFQRMGGSVLFNSECHRLVKNGDRIQGIETTRGAYSCSCVVNACGPWSRALAQTAGIQLSMKIVREQETIWQCRHSSEMPPASISNAVDAIYLRPLGDGRYTVGRGFPKTYTEADPNNYSRNVDDEFVNDVLMRLQRRFRPFSNARFLHGFASLYDVSCDWYPYLGLRSDVSGYADASGGSGHGFKLAPALGEHLSRWITGEGVEEDIRALSYDRVRENRMFSQKFGGNRG